MEIPNFHIRKLGEIMAFYAVCFERFWICISIYFFLFQNIISFYSFKIERVVLMTKFFYCCDPWMVFVFFWYGSYWIISNYGINPSCKISVLIIISNFEYWCLTFSCLYKQSNFHEVSTFVLLSYLYKSFISTYYSIII